MSDMQGLLICIACLGSLKDKRGNSFLQVNRAIHVCQLLDISVFNTYCIVVGSSEQCYEGLVTLHIKYPQPLVEGIGHCVTEAERSLFISSGSEHVPHMDKQFMYGFVLYLGRPVKQY